VMCCVLLGMLEVVEDEFYLLVVREVMCCVQCALGMQVSEMICCTALYARGCGGCALFAESSGGFGGSGGDEGNGGAGSDLMYCFVS